MDICTETTQTAAGDYTDMSVPPPPVIPQWIQYLNISSSEMNMLSATEKNDIVAFHRHAEQHSIPQRFSSTFIKWMTYFSDQNDTNEFFDILWKCQKWHMTNVWYDMLLPIQSRQKRIYHMSHLCPGSIFYSMFYKQLHGFNECFQYTKENLDMYMEEFDVDMTNPGLKTYLSDLFSAVYKFNQFKVAEKFLSLGVVPLPETISAMKEKEEWNRLLYKYNFD